MSLAGWCCHVDSGEHAGAWAPEEEEEVAAGEQAKLDFDMTINPTTPPVSTKDAQPPYRYVANRDIWGNVGIASRSDSVIVAAAGELNSWR